jgi:hypothetical protein
MLRLDELTAARAPKLTDEDLVALARALAELCGEGHACGIRIDDWRPSAFTFEQREGVWCVRVAADKPAESASDLDGIVTRSPERLRDASYTSVLSDVYGWGVLVHWLAMNRAPFLSGDLDELLLAIAQEEPASLQAARPALGREFVALVRRAMAPDEALRPTDGVELDGLLLAAIDADASAEADPPSAEDERAVAGDAVPASEAARATPGEGSFVLSLTLGLLLVILVVAGGYRLLAPSRPALPTTSVATLEAARALAAEQRARATASVRSPTPPASNAP